MGVGSDSYKFMINELVIFKVEAMAIIGNYILGYDSG